MIIAERTVPPGEPPRTCTWASRMPLSDPLRRARGRAALPHTWLARPPVQSPNSTHEPIARACPLPLIATTSIPKPNPTPRHARRKEASTARFFVLTGRRDGDGGGGDLPPYAPTPTRATGQRQPTGGSKQHMVDGLMRWVPAGRRAQAGGHRQSQTANQAGAHAQLIKGGRMCSARQQSRQPPTTTHVCVYVQPI
jgi:hypothetical protein